MGKHATIELFTEDLHFAAAHFIIVSATLRGPFHGHNFSVHVALDTVIETNGYNFDYRIYQKKILDMCKPLKQRFLLPENSDYLRIEDKGEYYHAHFNGAVMPFSKKDVVLLPVCNITVEELSGWFVEQLLQNQSELDAHNIHKIVVKVFTAPGQCGSAIWRREHTNLRGE